MTETTADEHPEQPDFAGSKNSAVTMYTTSWCGFCSRLKRGLRSEGIEFEEIDIERVDGTAEIVMAHNRGNRTVPTLIFADGSSLTNPTVAEVRERLAATA